jgi:hypothetical protein
MDVPYKLRVNAPDLSRGGTLYHGDYESRCDVNRPSNLIVFQFRAVRFEANHTRRLKSGAAPRYINGTSAARRDFRPTFFCDLCALSRLFMSDLREAKWDAAARECGGQAVGWRR